MSLVSVAVGLLAVAFLLLLLQRQQRTNRVPMTLVSDAFGNEALVLRGEVAGRGSALFMLDTAYAGPPVLSTSYLARRGWLASHQSVQREYEETMARMAVDPTDDERFRGVAELLSRGVCRSYTSGCTMRLMGIGVTQETQADMLLCPSLRFEGERQTGSAEAAGDVLVTNPLRGNVHILTMDYLLHRSPCVLLPRKGCIQFGLPPLTQATDKPSFEFLPASMLGGAFQVDMTVGGARLRVVVDTGAAAGLSIGKDVLPRLRRCQLTTTHAYQTGVNGERVCSDVLRVDVDVGGLRVEDVELFVNSSNVEGADGYAGMGLLRAFDLWLAPGELGVRPNGLPPRHSSSATAGACGGVPPACGV